MKALSVRQPWASMLVFGFKPVENRPRTSHYRGPLLIHASKTVDKEAMNWLWANERQLGLSRGWHLLPFRTGGIIGRVDMWNVSERSERLHCWPSEASEQDRRWFFGPFGYWMRNARELPFLPWRGQLGMFEVPVTDHYADGKMAPDGTPWEVRNESTTPFHACAEDC